MKKILCFKNEKKKRIKIKTFSFKNPFVQYKFYKKHKRDLFANSNKQKVPKTCLTETQSYDIKQLMTFMH